MKESSKPKKQRGRHYGKAIHLRKGELKVHLEKGLRKEIGKRALMVRANDKVKVARGKYRKKSGKVVKVDHKKCRVFIEKLTRKKSDGTERLIPFIASNLLLVEVNRDDRKRFKGTALKKAKKKEAVQEKKESVKDGKKR